MRVDARNKSGADFSDDIWLPHPLKMHCSKSNVNNQLNFNIYMCKLITYRSQ